ncbi:MAG: GIY-YIG nuclease family protein [Methanomassiliicoccaceae archaeon]|nr:GIY-YIG nuclease family protein [Methanomassiliicoccaceae archaeon]
MTATRRNGTYLLFLRFTERRDVTAGSLGTLTVAAGDYCYVGSAMNGLDSRIERHFRKEKTMRWHIDRLTVIADAMEAYVSMTRKECELSTIAEECECVPVFKGFGSSDCGCVTHLFRVNDETKLRLLNLSAVTPFPSKTV